MKIDSTAFGQSRQVVVTDGTVTYTYYPRENSDSLPAPPSQDRGAESGEQPKEPSALADGQATPTTTAPRPEFELEIPSRLFDGLVFLPHLITVKYKDKIAKNCQPNHFRLLWFFDCNGSVVDLDYAAQECWGKIISDEIVDDKVISFEAVKSAFYEVGKLFLQINLPAIVTVSKKDKNTKIVSDFLKELGNAN